MENITLSLSKDTGEIAYDGVVPAQENMTTVENTPTVEKPNPLFDGVHTLGDALSLWDDVDVADARIRDLQDFARRYNDGELTLRDDVDIPDNADDLIDKAQDVSLRVNDVRHRITEPFGSPEPVELSVSPLAASYAQDSHLVQKVAKVNMSTGVHTGREPDAEVAADIRGMLDSILDDIRKLDSHWSNYVQPEVYEDDDWYDEDDDWYDDDEWDRSDHEDDDWYGDDDEDDEWDGEYVSLDEVDEEISRVESDDPDDEEFTFRGDDGWFLSADFHTYR